MNWLLVILQLVTFSSLATDQCQTINWGSYTADAPRYVEGIGNFYEINPVLAGSSVEEQSQYFDWFKTFVQVAPDILGNEAGMLYTVGVSVLQLYVTYSNDNYIRLSNGEFDRCISLEYQLAF